VACFRLAPGAIEVSVRLTPRADRDAVEGIETLADGRDVARVRVRAVPEGGAANAALVALLAKTVRRPKSAVGIISGEKQRLKQVRITGDPLELARIVEGWPRRS
jgi:uncharacterized protein (TIGR00251 family)